VQPLIRDTNSNVRAQLAKLLAELPADDVRANAEQILLWTRLGLTHLSASIRLSSLDVLEWLLGAAPGEAVARPGAWPKTLRCLAGLVGWDCTETTSATGMRVANSGRPGAGSWTSVHGAAGKSAADVKVLSRTLAVLALFLEAGLLPSEAERGAAGREARGACLHFPLWQFPLHGLPAVSSPFAYLNLFGAPRDEEGMEYEDRVDRVRFFNERWRSTFMDGVERVKREGGGVGRVAVNVEKMIIAGCGG
jgi:pre-rRNA-processing protein IPI1